MGRRAKREQAEELTIRQRHYIARNTGLAYEAVYNAAPRSAKLRIAVEKLGTDRAVSEAFYGLIRAAVGFQPGLGNKFSTYAMPSIIRTILNAGEGCGRLNEKRRNVGYEPLPFLTQFPVGEDGRSAQDYIPSRQEFSHYSDEELTLLRKAIDRLAEPDRMVLARHHLGGETLHAVAQDLGLSKERVRQIGDRAIVALGEHLQVRDGVLHLLPPQSAETRNRLRLAHCLASGPKTYRELLHHAGLKARVLLAALEDGDWFFRERDARNGPKVKRWLYALTEQGRKELQEAKR